MSAKYVKNIFHARFQLNRTFLLSLIQIGLALEKNVKKILTSKTMSLKPLKCTSIKGDVDISIDGKCNFSNKDENYLIAELIDHQTTMYVTLYIAFGVGPFRDINNTKKYSTTFNKTHF